MFELFDEVEVSKKGDYKEIPEGTYTGNVTDVTLTESPDEQKAEIEFTLTTEEFVNRKVWLTIRANASMSDKAKQVMKTQICKLIGKDSTKGINVNEELANARGNTYELFIKPRIYNDKTYYNVYVNEQIMPF